MMHTMYYDVVCTISDRSMCQCEVADVTELTWFWKNWCPGSIYSSLTW